MEREVDRLTVASKDGISDGSGTRCLWVVVALLAAYSAWRFPFWLAHSDLDLDLSYVPWLAHILSVGHFRAMESSFADYNPAFIYSLDGAAYFARFFSLITVVKLNNLPYILLSAAVVLAVCRKLGCTWSRALAGAALIVVAPEVMENAWSWGQCDMIYTSFLVASFASAAYRKPALSMVCFGLAISFKLQAIFAGPLVLMLLLSGEIPFWTILLVPVTYLAVLTPAMIAGRPPLSLIFVYGGQFKHFDGLAYQTANPYMLFIFLARAAGAIRKIGYVLSALANVALLMYLWRRRDVLKSFTGIFVVGAMSVVLEIFTLPKMHERYYYPANIFLLALVAINPRRFWLPAAIMQVVCVFTYGSFLYQATRHGWQFLPLSLAVAYVFYALWREVERLQRSYTALKA